MLGLGSNMMKHPVTGKSIVRDGLVLQHNYNLSSVEPLSSGAANINADADGADFIDVGLIPITTNDVTISAWVYITDFINSCAIFSNRHGSSPNQGFAIRTATSPDNFTVITDEATTGSLTTSSSAKNTNQWYHVCAVLDRDGSQYLYVDGVLDGTPTDISGLADSLAHTTSARIGKNYSAYEMNGYICNVGYWNRVLDQDEIKSIMNKNYDSLSASEKTDLVSWWNLDSTVDSATEGSSFVYDNHHGGTDTLSGELITNGTLDTSSGWVVGDFTMSGTATVTTDGGNQYIQQTDMWDNNAKDGKLLKLSWEVVENSDSIQLKIGGFSGADFSAATLNLTSTVGSHSMYIEVDGTGNADAIVLWINHTAGKTLTIDNISLKEVQGNTGKLS